MKPSQRRKWWYVDNYLLTHPCIQCGETDRMVLEFDHRLPNKKSFAIKASIQRNVSFARLKQEIEKCDVRCVKCHKIRHINDIQT